MRTETAAYKIARDSHTTAPRLFVRAHFVRKAGDATMYGFSRDFASHDVLSPTVPKINCITAGTVKGNTQRIDPVGMESFIGQLAIPLLNVAGEITRYVSDPARPLMTAIASSGAISFIEVDNASGYPSVGHVVLDEGEAAEEDFKYTGKDLTTTPHRLTGVTRAQRGTTEKAHTAGTLVRNGEQLRRGMRLSMYAGYEELAEADYLLYARMEITAVNFDSGSRTWVLQAQDIQRLIKKTIFDAASPLNVLVLGPEHPLTILLKVLLSTGTATNGPYDVLSEDNGAGVPQGHVDIDGIEHVRDAVVPGHLMQFREIQPYDVKEWMESQILQPLNLVTYITQDGKFSVRRFGTPPFRNSAVFLPNAVVAAA